LAYVIAFKAGRYKNLILGFILPFFVTFLIRTIA
jgi:spermidine/putrescine transport system permease protein